MMNQRPIFVKCTKTENGNQVYININNIAYIDQREDGSTGIVCKGFRRFCEDITCVEESIDEVYERIEAEKRKERSIIK